MYVVIDALSRVREQHPSAGVPERLGKTLQQVGLSITMTSATDIASFALGTIAPIPAIRSFCLYAAIAIFFDWILQFTFFVACLALDEQRIDKENYDVICCVDKAKVPKVESECASLPKLSKKGVLVIFIERYYTRIVTTSRLFQAAVVVLGVVFFGTCCYGLTQISTDFKEHMVVPDNSYAIPFLDAEYEQFNDALLVVRVVPTNVDYTDPDVQNDLTSLLEKLRETWSLNAFVVSWFDQFVQYCRKKHDRDASFVLAANESYTIPADKFYPLLKEFLNSTENRVYGADLRFGKDGKACSCTARNNLLRWC